MPTPPDPIDALPTAPARTMGAATFVAAADAWVAAQPAFRNQINAAAENVYANAEEAEASATAAAGSASDAAGSADEAEAAAGLAVGASSYIATSSSSHSVTTGAKTFTGLQAGRSFQDGDDVVIKRRSDAGARLYGSVDVGGYNSGANTLAVTITQVVGSGGPFTDWIISHAAFEPLSPASPAEIRGGTDTLKPIGVDETYDALADVTLTYSGSNIVTSGSALDNTAFINGAITLTQNSTIPNLTNPIVGRIGHIKITQDGTTARTLAFGSNFKFPGNVTPVMTTTLGAIAFLDYEVISSTYVRANLTSMG